MVEIVGYKRMEGTSKKSGRPYSGYQIYGIQENSQVHGHECTEFFASDAVLGGMIPTIGANVELYYDKGWSGQAFLKEVRFRV